MFQNWFTTKCTAYVDERGRALTGDALEAAKHSLNARRCGHLVKNHAKFCSKCGAPAPNSWWRCSECGHWIGNESQTCPHCGKRQNVAARMDLAAGVWQKGDDVFAQRFDSLDVQSLMDKGLTIQEGQCAILLSGGSVEQVLPSGHYPPAQIVDMQLFQESGEAKSFVMVDMAEVPFPIQVTELRTKDDMEVELTCVVVLQFDPEHPVEFLTNVMRNSGQISNSTITACLSYDDIAHFILNDVDLAGKDFCNTKNIDQLFRDPETRMDLEEIVSSRLERNMQAAGIHFIRLKEVDFRGEAYERLRRMAGEVEEKRREIEFQMAATKLANDTARREAMSQQEMEDFMAQLAQEKNIKDMTRQHELEHLQSLWRLEQATAEQEEQNNFEVGDAEHEEKLKKIAKEGELERRRMEHDELVRQRLAEQRASKEYMAIEAEIQAMKVEAEQKAATGWLKIQQEKQAGQNRLEFERLKAYQGVDSRVLAAAIDDPIRGERMAKLAEMELQSKMTPELLLAAAAARGVPEAARALANSSAEYRAVVEKAKQENRDVYEKMLQMNERMFNKAAESMEKGNANVAGPTIVK